MYSLEDKKNWLSIYGNNNFNVSKACRKTNIRRTTVRIWKNSDNKELYFNGDCKEYTFAEAMELTREGYQDAIEVILDELSDIKNEREERCMI